MVMMVVPILVTVLVINIDYILKKLPLYKDNSVDLLEIKIIFSHMPNGVYIYM